MSFTALYPSVFGILRIDTSLKQNNAGIAGTGFVIGLDPLRILTCFHVVCEGTPANDGKIQYSITKRSDSLEDFDLRKVEISFLKVSAVSTYPELDLAILEVDPSTNLDVSTKLGIPSVAPVALSMDSAERQPGRDVHWISTAGTGDVTLTPRYFKGHIISKYKTQHGYSYTNLAGANAQQIMPDIDMIEVDKLFIPGVSGSPVVDTLSGKVIGYVHGFRSWPIPTASEVTQGVEIIEGTKKRSVQMKSLVPLVASLSLAIDLRSATKVLNDLGLI